jgi:predicted SAM-dependent methyltransferase
MKWRVKALAQRALSHLPAGEQVNRFAEFCLGKGLTDAYLAEVVDTAREHLRIVQQYGFTSETLRAFEFGAGRHLLKPLLLSLYGWKHQIAFDLRPLASVRLANEAIASLRDRPAILGVTTKDPRPIGSLADLQQHYGISYSAPADARATGIADDSIDVVSSTDVLEHVPLSDLRAILRETHRILVPGGIAVHTVNCMDHFASFDPSISIYNFLQFSEAEWRKYNSFIHYQNRMRHREYVELFREAGFEVLEQNLNMPSDAELAALNGMRVAACFSPFSLEELSIRGAWHVLRKSVSA